MEKYRTTYWYRQTDQFAREISEQHIVEGLHITPVHFDLHPKMRRFLIGQFVVQTNQREREREVPLYVNRNRQLY